MQISKDFYTAPLNFETISTPKEFKCPRNLMLRERKAEVLMLDTIKLPHRTGVRQLTKFKSMYVHPKIFVLSSFLRGGVVEIGTWILIVALPK